MTSSGEELPSEEMEDDLPPLLQAARNADVATFKKMLEDGEDVLQKDEDDRTVLHWAAQSGCVPIIMAGVARGLIWHVNAKSKRGLTPLHEACLAGYVRTVHVLMSIGADTEAQTEEGYTPLLCAAGNGHNDITRILVGGGCDPNKNLPMIGVNALHIAAWTDQPDVLADLLIMGGDINKKSLTRKTAMEFAREQNHTDCVNVLQKHEQKLQQHFKTQLSEQESFFRTKLNLLADKIHKYYDDRLKQEIEYFEQQLQEQHDKDAEIILKLKSRIDHLLKTELDDEDEDGHDDDVEDDKMESKARGGEEKTSLHPDRVNGQNSKMSLRRRRRSSQFAHRPRMFSITTPHAPTEHESSDDEHAHGIRRRYDRQISVDGHRQPRRPGGGRPGSGRIGSGKNKSMTELVDDVSKKPSSVNFVKRQGSVMEEHDGTESSHMASQVHLPGVPTIRLLQPSKPTQPRSSTPTRTRSTTPSHVMSITPSVSSLSPSPPPPSPISPSTNTGSMSPTPSNVSTSDSVFLDSNENQLTASSKPKSRRSSIAAFLRPHFKSSSSVMEEEKSRRRSVETKIPDAKSTASSPRKPRKKGFSLFSIPLPGIPQGMIEEDSFEDIDMDQTGS
ncbi:protein phosphatase 1 regulatory subunit 12A-like [Lytechinus variegatus]|uniref:protein phosphatase 1 regulatory subunit 12A-like n=1 Tax=Lytechinus variegatus TaxID=7654 RepID=UPI001BB1AFF6|nr:protein phosphatase 1 regulatory subunit 12A-like [Lytechinus variegatus]XP_041476824.1 protein phosphatase 1 regulatory subunit 12A-like [Lytechinus variegatus]